MLSRVTAGENKPTTEAISIAGREIVRDLRHQAILPTALVPSHRRGSSGLIGASFHCLMLLAVTFINVVAASLRLA